MLQCVRAAFNAASQMGVRSVSALPTAALPRGEIERWATAPLPALMAEAARLRDLGHGNVVSYSRKVFIPLTQLCRDACRYCTFAHGPRGAQRAYLTPDEVLAIARAGAGAGCQEALFTLGDKPELRYEAARRGAGPARPRDDASTISPRCARWCCAKPGLLPHVNPGVMTRADIAALRQVSVSQGIMLESVVAAAVRARRAALRLARQGAGGAARDHRGGRRAARCRSPPAS